MRVDFIADEVDTTAPVVDATVTGTRNGAGDYLGRATLTLTATDSSGVARTEYSTRRQPELDPYTAPVGFTTRGAYTVQLPRDRPRRDANTSAAQTVTFSVVSGDELPARAVGRVQRHAGHDAAGASGIRRRRPPARARRPSADGSLVLPLGNISLDLDAYRARSGPGPAAAHRRLHAGGQDLRSGAGRRRRRPTVSRYAQVGLKLFQTNDNWIKVAHTRNADGNPTGVDADVLRDRRTSRTGRARSAPGWAWRARTCRRGGSGRPHRRTITSAYSLTDPEVGANWVALSGTPNIDTVMPPASGPRYIGAYGGNGSISARYDYMRFTPDNAIDRAAPSTSHTLAPAPGRRQRLVPHAVARDARSAATTASASRASSAPSTASTAARSRRTARRSASAPTGPTRSSTARLDKAGNAETAKSVTVKLDATAPATTAATDGHRARSR